MFPVSCARYTANRFPEGSALFPAFGTAPFAILFFDADHAHEENPVKWFDYAAPRTLDQAVAAMATHPDARPLAGGTDLLV